MNIGLPEFFDWFTYEFGVYDSEGPDLVIGENSGYPVFIDSSSGAVFAQDEPDTRRWFLNSSVELLSRFLHLISEFQRVPDDTAGKDGAFTQMRQEMIRLDSPALSDPSKCVWACWIDQ